MLSLYNMSESSLLDKMHCKVEQGGSNTLSAKKLSLPNLLCPFSFNWILWSVKQMVWYSLKYENSWLNCIIAFSFQEACCPATMVDLENELMNYSDKKDFCVYACVE